MMNNTTGQKKKQKKVNKTREAKANLKMSDSLGGKRGAKVKLRRQLLNTVTTLITLETHVQFTP